MVISVMLEHLCLLPLYSVTMTMDWKRCIIFQKDISEALRCPLNSSTGTIDDKKQPYIVLLKNIQEFKSINALPVQLNFENETVEN